MEFAVHGEEEEGERPAVLHPAAPFFLFPRENKLQISVGKV